MGIMRLSHVSLYVMAIDEAVHHYTEVVGLIETGRGEDGSVYLKGWDEWDKYSIVLIPSDRAGVRDIAFKVEHSEDLDQLCRRIGQTGRAVARHEIGAVPFCGPAISFDLPSGHQTYLFAEKECVGRAVGDLNPDPWPDGVKGAGGRWLDHVMLIAPFNPAEGINKVAENVAFFTDVMQFKLVEQIMVGPDSSVQLAAWLARTSTPHDIAFGAGPKAGLHHVSFFVESWNEVLHAADVLAKHRVVVDVSPQRHGITRGPTTYFFDPSGNRNEIFGGLGYLTQPDMPTITWNEAEMWRGVFFLTGEPAEEFLSVYT